EYAWRKKRRSYGRIKSWKRSFSPAKIRWIRSDSSDTPFDSFFSIDGINRHLLMRSEPARSACRPRRKDTRPQCSDYWSQYKVRVDPDERQCFRHCERRIASDEDQTERWGKRMMPAFAVPPAIVWWSLAGRFGLLRSLLHGCTMIGDFIVVDRADIHGGDVLAVCVEDHVSSDAMVVVDLRKGIMDACAVEARLADGLEQDLHGVIGERCELFGLLVVGGLVTGIEVEPAPVGTRRIVGKNSFHAFCGWSRQSKKLIAEGTMTTEDPLLHAKFTHLLEDQRRGFLIGPYENTLDMGTFDDFEFAAEVGVTGSELLFYDNGMSEAVGGFTELANTEAAVTVIDA